MANGKRDFLVDALISQSVKHATLSSDAARWGWVLMMGAAKFQQPQGSFKSVSHLQACLGAYSKHADELAAAFCDQNPSGSLRVRHWRSWQPKGTHSTQRVADWRLKIRVFERDEYTCRYCGAWDFPEGLTSDVEGFRTRMLCAEHVNPQGPNDETNVVTSCRSCNKRKGSRTPERAGMELHAPRWKADVRGGQQSTNIVRLRYGKRG